ncbi:hypothetical protein AXG93_4280s1200 [Marchantia polymorpha subsp. ruderalis]|uniref:Uncharacterized protein n=1 Tax=Marchantia polymorpha subsp. ruderalis TaxID=1480154 RepID=A0A176WN72_MARPO|nr:hypothetical protein AXG93_4280s1200 [Marchantia polymorpha subsp. ruderalis]
MSRRAMGQLVFLLVGLVVFVDRCSAYGQGDFVPTSRKGQYHNMRTDWMDQLGRHCPRFGIDNEVVLPLPKPTGYTGADPYKMCDFSVHGQLALFFAGYESITLELEVCSHRQEFSTDSVTLSVYKEESSEIDVAGGLYVLFGSGLVLTVAMALHILQSSKEKLSRFIKETVVDSAMPAEEAKVE